MCQERKILIADMRSFYASVEQAIDPRLKGKPVVVSGDPERRSGIVLAASPEAKAMGVKTAMVTWEALQVCRDAVLVRPKMAKYIDFSMQIRDIAAKYTDLVEVYSIDELFMDVTHVQHLFGDAWTIARKFQEEVRRTCGIETCVGIGYNKFMAKMVLDNKAKKTKDQIAEWKPEDVGKTMHPMPVSDMFMVGSRMTRNFMKMGIRTIGQLAHCDKNRLIKKWGIMGQVYHDLSWGRDDSPVNVGSFHGEKGIGHMITLAKDYSAQQDIETVLLELTEEVCRRTRKAHKAARTVTVSCKSADETPGFHRQLTLAEPTNFTQEIYEGVIELFRTHWNRQSVRAVGVGVTNLCEDNELQLSLFEDREKKRSLSYTMDRIREKYGTAALLWGVSKDEAGVMYERAGKIGGHWA